MVSGPLKSIRAHRYAVQKQLNDSEPVPVLGQTSVDPSIKWGSRSPTQRGTFGKDEHRPVISR